MESQIFKIIKEICNEENIKLKGYSFNYILELKKNDKKLFVFGNKFPNNNASAEIICNDKAGTSIILSEYNIANVEHKIFLSPERPVAFKNNWNELDDMLKKYETLVLKPNKGTGGQNVHKVKNQKEIEQAIFDIFGASQDLAVCPFYEIEDEFRVIMLNNEFQYAFRKIRPFVIGNGKDSIKKLWESESVKWPNFKLGDFDLNYVPKRNEKVYLSWKHNLGQGAIPELVTDKRLIDTLEIIAKKCTKALLLDFVSIDIIKTSGEFKVLEINSGIMIDAFSAYSPKYYALAKNAVKKAILNYLGQ